MAQIIEYQFYLHLSRGKYHRFQLMKIAFRVKDKISYNLILVKIIYITYRVKDKMLYNCILINITILIFLINQDELENTITSSQI